MKKLLLVLSLLALASLAFGQSSSHVTGSTEATQLPTFNKHTLMATYISEGYGQSVPPNYVPIDAVHTISCPGTSGTCTFQLDAWVQARYLGTDQNYIAICFYVDGSLVSGYCYYSGEFPSNGSYFEVSTSLSKDGIPVGAHTVQTYIYTDSGADVGYYNSNYKVYKP